MTEQANQESQESQEKKKAFKKRPRAAAGAKVQVSRGNVYIQATYNNTIITVTDQNGNVIAWSSAGQKGFSGAKKATPYAASQIARDVVEKTKAYGLREIFIYVKGVGSGRESAMRTLNAAGLQIIGIKDITPIPHNGPRMPKPRRI